METRRLESPAPWLDEDPIMLPEDTGQARFGVEIGPLGLPRRKHSVALSQYRARRYVSSVGFACSPANCRASERLPLVLSTFPYTPYL